MLWAISTLLFSTNLSYASDARVDSMGGLTLIATDEADDINPFTLGNPAGLALLAPQTRFDAAGEWIDLNFPNEGLNFHIYGARNELDTDSVRYHGLMTFLSPNFAIQADADTLHTENEDEPSTHTDPKNLTRELIRAAYNFGPFVLGAQVQPEQASSSFAPYQFEVNTQVLSGTGTTNNLTGTFGLLINFPSNTDPKQSHFQIGGTVSTQLNPFQEADTLNAVNSGTTFVLTNRFTESNLMTWGPEIYFKNTNAFELGLISRFSSFDINAQEDSSNQTAFADVPTFKAESGNIAVVLGILKMSTPLDPALNLNVGCDFSFQSLNSTTFDSTATPTGGTTETGWTAQAGLGFEDPEVFTLGVQGELQETTGNSNGLTVNFVDYKIKIGGEHSLAKNWAFRMGVIYEDANDLGTAPKDLFLYTIDGLDITNTTMIAGLGYQDSFLKADFNLSWGQPFSAETSVYANQLGSQLAISLKFN